jgi:hypothetical protein
MAADVAVRWAEAEQVPIEDDQPPYHRLLHERVSAAEPTSRRTQSAGSAQACLSWRRHPPPLTGQNWWWWIADDRQSSAATTGSIHPLPTLLATIYLASRRRLMVATIGGQGCCADLGRRLVAVSSVKAPSAARDRRCPSAVARSGSGRRSAMAAAERCEFVAVAGLPRAQNSVDGVSRLI